MRILKKLLIVAALFGFGAIQAEAQNYPTRPVRVLVGFAAGSSADVSSRVIANKLSELLGQPVVIENRAGASSLIATEVVSRAEKDGHTLLFATVAATINTSLMPGKGPNFEKDLEPITLVGSIPNILVVHPKLGVNNVAELIAMAKAKPGELLYGASGIGSGPQMTAELFKQMAGVQMTPVLYPGSAQTVTDLVAGRINLMFSPSSTVLGLIQEGSVKAIATSEARRTSAAPNLPTISESGLPGFDTGVWFGLLAPTGTPAPVIDKLSKAVNEALKDPKVVQALQVQGMDPTGGTPDEFRKFIRSETERWAKIVEAMPKK